MPNVDIHIVCFRTWRRLKYNEEEDVNIIEYLVNSKRWNEVKGKKLWNDMATKEV